MEEKLQLDKVLCFGVLCHLMLIFANKIDTVYMSQEKLVSRFVSYVDKNNNLLLSDKDKINADPEVEEVSPGLGPKGKLKGHNASEISRIMRGNSFFKLYTNLGEISVSDSADLFRNRMASYFLEDDKPLLMLSLLDITKNDTHISDDMRKSFVTSIDEKGVNYSFPEFMIKILLYTAHNGASKAVQKKCLDNIYKYLDTKKRGKAKFSMDNEIVLANHINEVSNYYSVSTYEWKFENQTLTIFDKSILQGVSPETIKTDNSETIKIQNDNPSEGNYKKSDIPADEITSSQVDEFVEESLIAEEEMEQNDKPNLSDTDIKSNTKSQEEGNTEKSNETNKCGFCTLYEKNEMCSGVGWCKFWRKLVNISDSKCYYFSPNKKEIKRHKRNLKKHHYD